MGLIEANANGNTFLEINKRDFRPIPVLVPPNPVLQEFGQLAGAFYSGIVENLRTSRIVTALQDALLPKLISGDLRVKDGEVILKRVL